MADEVSPGTVARAVARVVYGDLVTVVVTSLLFTLAALPVVTLGAALLALVETWTTVVTRRDTGAPPSERGRAELFLGAVVRNIRAGLPYTLVLSFVGGLTGFYYVVGTARGSGLFLLAALVGLYGVVVVLAWSLRAASVRARSERPLGFRGAVTVAGETFLDRPSFAVLVAVALAGVLVVGAVVRVVVPLVVPAVLAVIEVVAFEELGGDGAAAVRATYR